MIHLGDYVYEYGTSTNARTVIPDHEFFRLYEYRKRLASSRTDLDLLLSHLLFAWIPVWAEREVSNDCYRDASSNLNNTSCRLLHMMAQPILLCN